MFNVDDVSLEFYSGCNESGEVWIELILVYLFDGIEKIQLVLFCFFCFKFLIKQKGNKIGSLCVSVLGGEGGEEIIVITWSVWEGGNYTHPREWLGGQKALDIHIRK